MHSTLKTIPLPRGGQMHKLLVLQSGESSPIDLFAAHLPDVKPGLCRRLLKARTNRSGRVLLALVHDVK